MRVHICGDRSSIGVDCNGTEHETVGLDGDRFAGVSLKQTCRQEQANFDIWDAGRADLEESQIAKLLNYIALSIYLETFGNSLELHDCSRQSDWTLEVVEVGRDRNAYA